MKIKLAEALLRRKELQEKVRQVALIKDNQLIYQIRSQRIKAQEGLDDLNLDMPKLELNQVTAEYDFYAKALRLIDAHIQQCNWTAEIEVDEKTMNSFSERSTS